ncbi:expressed protein [Dictyostelium purpureum]|uniref:Expressed protein n=1 Tax=Dictyostelium purpureum TaxID=5786 RepID=F1A0K4_DICPU|nr:uncharacterized protein DICPUDRAFT_93000 [Dictyostelium purpureum]EGC30275.1 expressed protein [Dictyostelium purpureum]|eukprot:XP_003293202.1 expressed protein [Dictyostelium purpureum]
MNNIINYCYNRCFNSNNASDNKSDNKSNNNNNISDNCSTSPKKTSITINLKPDSESDNSENNIIKAPSGYIENNQNEKEYILESCVCNSGKKYEIICTDCHQLLCTLCNSTHIKHKLLKIEINSIVFQKILKSNQNLMLLENAKSNFCKVEELIMKNQDLNNNSPELDQYMEFIDLAIKNVIVENENVIRI